MNQPTENNRTALQRVIHQPWLPLVVSLLAGIVFLAQALYYAHTQDVTMDEGTYLMKGLLYTRGDYQPFEPYGPWTNKMPLAFYIPGAVQMIFGPGLRSGRYFSVFLAVLMLLGLWILSRRLAGRWFAAGIMAISAASSVNIMLYTWAVSQVIVASLLTWSLVLTVGKDRPIWQLILGAVLAVVTVLTRQNMLPVIPLIWLYIFWQHGLKAGAYAAGVSGLFFLGMHALFWPGIWTIWRPWLPDFIRQLVPSPPRGGDIGKGIWNPEFTTITRVYVFWEGIRFHFLALWGALVSWILWPRRKAWKSDERFKIAVFSSILLVVLTAAHFWAAAFKDFCLFCYSGYISFFAPVGILLVVASFSSWVRNPGPFRQAAAAVVTVVGATGIAFGGYQQISEPILNLTIPRISNMRIMPGSTQLWRSLSNKFGLAYESLQQLLPAIAGLFFALSLLVAIALVVLILRKKRSISFGYTALTLFLAAGVLLTPTPLFAGDRLGSLCGLDVIASHEAVGKELAAHVPPGSLVFWQNDVSPLPLLYIPNVRVYPSQLNHWYTFRIGGDPALLPRYGYWNKELQQQWLQEADYALVADVYISALVNNGSINEKHEKITVTPLTVPCREQSTIHVYRRLP
jgi:hypothetical protein